MIGIGFLSGKPDFLFIFGSSLVAKDAVYHCFESSRNGYTGSYWGWSTWLLFTIYQLELDMFLFPPARDCRRGLHYVAVHEPSSRRPSPLMTSTFMQEPRGCPNHSALSIIECMHFSGCSLENPFTWAGFTASGAWPSTDHRAKFANDAYSVVSRCVDPGDSKLDSHANHCATPLRSPKTTN